MCAFGGGLDRASQIPRLFEYVSDHLAVIYCTNDPYVTTDPRTMGKEEMIEVICNVLKNRMKVKVKLQELMPQVENNVFDILKI